MARAVRVSALPAAALREVALEGSQGVALTALWPLLGTAVGRAPDAAARRFIWTHLLAAAEAGDVRLRLRATPQQQLPPPAGASAAADAPPPPLPAPADVAPADPRVRDVDAAEALHMHLTASLALRNGVLGIYDPGVSASETVTAVHRLILEAAARGRSRGALQADCARAAGIPNNNFFYQVTRLEARGLLKRAAVVLRPSASSTGSNATNLLFLPCFAQEYVANLARARAAAAPAALPAPAAQPRLTAGGEGDASDGDEAAAGGTALPSDDAAAIRTICTRLATATDQRAKEGELKRVLGYTGVVAHRSWRRLREKMTRLGLVRVEPALLSGDKADKKPVPIVTLLRPFTEADTDSIVQSVGGLRPRAAGVNAPAAAVEDDAGVGVGVPPPPPIAADVGLEAQIVDFVVASGAEGVTSNDILVRFALMDGLDRENFARLEARLLKCGAFTVSARLRARATSKVMVASDALRKRLGLAPLAPPAPPPAPNGAPGDASGPAAPAPAPPAAAVPAQKKDGGIISGEAAMRRRSIMNALARDGMVPRAALWRLLNSAMPADGPRVDRKTADATATALENEGLLRRWEVVAAVKGDSARSVTHTVFVPRNAPAAPSAEQKEKALQLVDAARRGPQPPPAGAEGAHLPTLHVAPLPPGPAGVAGGVAGALAASVRVQAARARENRRTGYVRAKMRRAQHLHTWLCATLLPAAAAAPADAPPPQPVSFRFEELLQRMPLDLVMQNVSHRSELDGANGGDDDDDDNDAEDAGAAGAAAGEAGGGISGDGAVSARAFLARVEAAAVRGERVSDLSPDEARRLLHAGTRAKASETLRTLVNLGLLSFEANAVGSSAEMSHDASGALSCYTLASAGRFEAPQRDAAGAWVSEAFTFRAASDVAAYWAGLEAAFAPAGGGKTHRAAAAATAAQRFPGAAVPHVAKRAQWTPGWLPAKQRLALAEHLVARRAAWEADADPEATDDAAALTAAAERIGVPRERLLVEVAEERRAFIAARRAAGSTYPSAALAAKRKATEEAAPPRAKPPPPAAGVAAGKAAPKAKATTITTKTKAKPKSKAAATKATATAAAAAKAAGAGAASGGVEKCEMSVEELKALAAAAALKATPQHAIAYAQGLRAIAAAAPAAAAAAGRGKTGAVRAAAAQHGAAPRAAGQVGLGRPVGGGAADDDVADGGWDDLGDEDGDDGGAGSDAADAACGGARAQRVSWRLEDDRRLAEAVAEWRAAQPASVAAGPTVAWERVTGLPAPAARCGPRWVALNRDAARSAVIGRFLVAVSERRRRAVAAAVATRTASAPPMLVVASEEAAAEAAEASARAEAARAEAVEAAAAAELRLSHAKAALVVALTEMHARPPLPTAAPKTLSAAAAALPRHADVAQPLPVAAASSLLLLHLLTAPPPPPSSIPGWAAAAAAAAHAAAAHRAPPRAELAAALRALGGEAVAAATAALQCAGHVSGSFTLTPALYDAAAGAAGMPPGLGPAAASAAARLLALAPGEEAAALAPPTPNAPATSPGDVAAALGLVASGALALAVQPPRRGGTEALGAAAAAGEAPRPEALFRLCNYAARPADAPDEGGEGGGENEEEGASDDARPQPGRGTKRSATAPHTDGTAVKKKSRGGATPSPAGDAANAAEVAEPEAALAAALTAWVAAGAEGARLGAAPLRAAAAAITAAGVAGVTVAQLADACFGGAGAAPEAAAAADCLSASGFSVSVSVPLNGDAGDACLVAAAAAAPYRLTAPGLAGSRVTPWEALAHVLQPVAETRAIALALRHPGAPEEALVAAMPVLPPAATVALLQRLEAEGKLVVRVVPPKPRWDPPVKRRPGLPPPPVPQPLRHYFAGPMAVQFLS